MVQVEAEDAEWLRSEIGLRAFFDLRSHREVRRDGGPHTLMAAGVQWVHVPVDEEKVIAIQSSVRSAEEFAGGYIRMLAGTGLALRALMEALADFSSAPLAFGCTAGKDRTGVLAALLLTALKVPRGLICRDYAWSGHGLWAGAKLLRRCAERHGLSEESYVRRLEPDQRAMTLFLARCDELYGSAAEMFRRLGINDGLAAAVRKRCTEPWEAPVSVSRAGDSK